MGAHNNLSIYEVRHGEVFPLYVDVIMAEDLYLLAFQLES